MMTRSVNISLLWVTIFSIAFAYVESSVVVYLRMVFYPEGFNFPLQVMPSHTLMIELGREFATMVMLAAIGYITGRSLIEKFFYFILSFGIWDIFYYIWLKLFLNWPSSLLEDDILFLIPVPWVGPVITPVIVSVTFISAGLIGIYMQDKVSILKITKMQVLAVVSGLTIIFISFIWMAFSTDLLKDPDPGFPWIIFFIGEIILIAGCILFIRNNKASRLS